MVVHQPLRAVALNTEQIRLHQHIRDARASSAKTLPFKDALHARAQRARVNLLSMCLPLPYTGTVRTARAARSNTPEASATRTYPGRAVLPALTT